MRKDTTRSGKLLPRTTLAVVTASGVARKFAPQSQYTSATFSAALTLAGVTLLGARNRGPVQNQRVTLAITALLLAATAHAVVGLFEEGMHEEEDDEI